MKCHTTATAVFLVCVFAQVVLSVPPTGGTGPGGLDATNLQGWFQADQLTLSNGDAVTSWTDSSGKGFNAVQATAGLQPTFQTGVQNGFPTVRFDGSDRLQTADTSAWSGDQPYSVVSAFSVNAFGNSDHDNPLFAIGSVGAVNNNRSNVHLAFEGNDSPLVNRLNGGAPTHNTSGSIGLNTFRTLNNWYEGGGLSNYNLTIDGDLKNTTNTNSNTHNFANGALRIGDQSIGFDSNPNFNGDVSEIAFYNRALNTTERVITDNYLSAKYNAPLNTTGSAIDVYAGDMPSNGDFDFNVFGIGQTNASDNVTAAGSAGFGIEATAGLDDGEFILAGHNSLTNGVTDGDWDRIWYVDTNGSDVDVTLAFDYSDASLGPPTESELSLLFSLTDPNNLQPIATEMLSGDTVTFDIAGADLQSGFYSVGAVAAVPEPASLAIWLMLGAAAWYTARRRIKS